MVKQYKNIKEQELKIGQCSEISKRITEQDVLNFAEITGDQNPAHIDEEYAQNTSFQTRIAHGMLGVSLISSVLGMQLPGPGTIYLEQDVQFKAPIHFDDVIIAKVTVEKIIYKKKFTIVILDTTVLNQNGEVLIAGTAKVIPPK